MAGKCCLRFRPMPLAWVASARRTIYWRRGRRSGCSSTQAGPWPVTRTRTARWVLKDVRWGSRGAVKVDGCLGRLGEDCISFFVGEVLQLNHGVTANTIDDEHGDLQLSGCVTRVAHHIFGLSKGRINSGVADGRHLIQRRLARALINKNPNA